MTRFLALVKLDLIQLFGLGKFRHNDRKKRSRAILMAALYGFLCLLSCTYSGGIAFLLCNAGLAQVVMGMMLAACGILCFITTVFRYTGILGNARDRTFLLSLPVSTTQVVLSRFFDMYLLDIAFAALLMVPATIIYGLYVPVSAWFIIAFIPMLLVTPLFPMAIAVPMGMLITFIASRVRHKNAMNSILSFVLFIGIMAFSLSASGMSEADMTHFLSDMGQIFSRVYFPAGFFVNALNGDYLSFAIYLCGSLALLSAAIFLAGRFFLSLSDSMGREQTHGKLKGDAFAAHGVFRALFRKEARRYFSCTIWLVNTALSPLMLLLLAVAFCVFPSDQIARVLSVPELSGILTPILPFIICLICGLGATSASSLSLEGNARFSLAALPIKPGTIYNAKIALNLLVLLPAVLVGGVIFAVGLQLSGTVLLYVFLLPTIFSCFTAVFGMAINVRFPKFDYTLEAQVVKQSVSTLIVTFSGMLLPIAPVILLFTLGTQYTDLISGAFGGLFLLLTVFLYARLRKTPMPV